MATANEVREQLARYEDPIADADASAIASLIDEELDHENNDQFEILLAIEGRNGSRIWL